MLLGSKAVVFYALFSGRTGGRNAKRSIKRTDLCRRIINIIPEAILEKKNCSKKSPIIMRATLRMQWSR